MITNPRLDKVIGRGTCVFDLGCGSGELLTQLDGRFARCIGFDVSRRRLDRVVNDRRDRWEFRSANLNEQIPAVDASADLVIANQVIEHILDPFKFTREIYRVLEPGGRCVITTPNIRSFKHIARIVCTGYGPRTAGGNTIDGAWDDGHVHYFTHRDLREIFLCVGFTTVGSTALVDVRGGGHVRKTLDHLAKTWLVREFLSGCILLIAEKS